MARFDWYQGTVRGDVRELRACLLDLAPGQAWQPEKTARQGYAFADRLDDAGGLVARVWWGGSHPYPHAVLTGESAAPGADLLRTHFPDHSVSRADACIDYADPGAYERLQGIAVGVAASKRIKVGTAGDHLVTMRGRTCYLGATSSHTRLRLYDKAEELRQQFAADPVRLATVPEELARLECQVRPQTPQARRAAAQVDAMTLMGSAAWMRELMRQVAGLELHPFEAGKPWRQADDDRAYAAMLGQYGGLMKRLVNDLGSWHCFGMQLGHDLAERDQAKRRRS